MRKNLDFTSYIDHYKYDKGANFVNRLLLMQNNIIKKLTRKEINSHLLLIDGWAIKNDLKYISKTFIFVGFKEAFSWMSSVSIEAEQLNHHPNWSNVYNKIEVKLFTHDVSGLSKKDFLMASYMDQEFISGK